MIRPCSPLEMQQFGCGRHPRRVEMIDADEAGVAVLRTLGDVHNLCRSAHGPCRDHHQDSSGLSPRASVLPRRRHSRVPGSCLGRYLLAPSALNVNLHHRHLRRTSTASSRPHQLPRYTSFLFHKATGIETWKLRSARPLDRDSPLLNTFDFHCCLGCQHMSSLARISRLLPCSISSHSNLNLPKS